MHRSLPSKPSTLPSFSRVKFLCMASCIFVFSPSAFANEAVRKTSEESQDTFSERLKTAIEQNEVLGEAKDSKSQSGSILEEKIIEEDKLLDNARGILSHNLNYFLPITYKSRSAYNYYSPSLGFAEADASERNIETHFQFSFKAPLVEVSKKYKSRVFFGFTARSWWQVYNTDSSSPFRETNYEPEFFWEFPFRLKPLKTEFINARLGIVHESNGQDIPYSRSWNRIYASFEWEDGDWIFQFKPWYRLPESGKPDPNSVEGDDNPDIEKYMGNFELRAVLKNHRNQLAFTVRNNLRLGDNRGAILVDWIYPTKDGHLQPYIQLFHGYGDSLIDYNQEITRIGFGVLLSDWY